MLAQHTVELFGISKRIEQFVNPESPTSASNFSEFMSSLKGALHYRAGYAPGWSATTQFKTSLKNILRHLDILEDEDELGPGGHREAEKVFTVDQTIFGDVEDILERMQQQGESEANQILNITSTILVNYKISEPPKSEPPRT